MARVLVTGGTGILGRELVPRLKAEGYTVRVMSRKSPSQKPWPDVEWAQADLETGSGLAESVSEVDILIHAATDSGFTPQGVNLRPTLFPKRGVDVEGTQRLLEQAKKAKVSHFIYPCIVGIDRIEIPYYRHKVQAEELTKSSGIPWSILRATQFHNLVDSLLLSLSRWPVLLLPTDFQYQSIASGEVAERLLEIVRDGPSGRLPDIGGPQVETWGQLARIWLEARGWKRKIIHLPAPGSIAEGFRRGYLTCPDEQYGKVTWREWVDKKYASGGNQDD